MDSDKAAAAPRDRAAAIVEPEEQARANLYGLVSRLFCAPGDPGLLAEVSGSAARAGADGAESGLGAAWSALQQGCRSANPGLVHQEYDSLFIGVGRAEVTPYLSAYATALAPDRYLVDLRNQLAAWGFGRRSEVFEMEDHVSGICDVMRCLIEGGHSLAEQKGFFDEFAYPSAIAFFAAVHNAPDAGFYKLAAEFARELFELERAAFDMEEAC